tara:strand:+ start:396 stop:1799 length:1404 start_codon:yes stop_codon:yes gene_type:complete
MSRWDTSFQNNMIHTFLDELDSIKSVEVDNIDVNHKEERDRLLKLSGLLRDLLNKADPEVTNITELSNAINPQMGNLNAWISAYKTNKNLAYLQNINNTIESPFLRSIVNLSAVTKRASTAVSRDIKQSSEEFHRYLEEKEKESSIRVDKLENKITEQFDKLEESRDVLIGIRTEMLGLKDDWDNKFSERYTNFENDLIKVIEKSREELDKKLNEVSDNWSQREAELEKSSNDVKNRLLEAEKKSNNDINEFIVKKENYIDTELGNIVKSTDEFMEDKRSKSEETYNKIFDLYKLVSKTAVKGGYLEKSAEESEKSKNLFIASIATGVVACIWLIVMMCMFDSIFVIKETTTAKDLVTNTVVGLKVSKIMLNISIIVILLSFSSYFAKLSGRHREEARKAHWMALETGTFDSFVETLNEDTKSELKKELTKKLFGHSQEDKKEDKENIFKSLDVLDRVSNTIKNFKS